MRKELKNLGVALISLILSGLDCIHEITTNIESLFIVDNLLYLLLKIHMLKQDRTIIHVEVKDTHEHFYFGSAAAMFEDSRVSFHIKRATARPISEDRPFENEFVIVRKGNLNTIDHNEL